MDPGDPGAGTDAAHPDTTIVETDRGAQRYTGQLAMTSTVRFGGSPYCEYSVTLRSIVLDVTLHPTRGLTTMSIADTVDEAIVGTCPFPPAADSRQFFAFQGAQAANAAGAFVPTMQGQPSNSPMTEATVLVTPRTETVVDASVRWERTDQGPPLKWVVTTSSPVALQRVTCEMNDLYCLGTSTLGSLHRCSDGLHLVEVNRCPSGCAPSQSPPGQHVDEACN